MMGAWGYLCAPISTLLSPLPAVGCWPPASGRRDPWSRPETGWRDAHPVQLRDAPRPADSLTKPVGCQVSPGIYRLAVAGDEGGTMFDYKGKRWRDLAARAMRRDGYMCQLSRRYGKRVPAEVVHHIYPVDEYPEYAYCLWNLISLSRAMHNRLPDRKTYGAGGCGYLHAVGTQWRNPETVL